MKSPSNHPEFPVFATVTFQPLGGGDYRMIPGKPVVGWLESAEARKLLQVERTCFNDMCARYGEEGVFNEGVDWRWKNATGSGGERLLNPESVAHCVKYGPRWRRIVASERAREQSKTAGRKAA